MNKLLESINRSRSRRACAAILTAVLVGSPPLAGAADGNGQWADPCRPANEARSAAIHELYEQRDRVPVWLTHDGRTRSGERLIRLLESTDGDVMTDCLERALAADGDRYPRGALDVLLTDAYLELSERRASGETSLRDHIAALAPGAHQRRQRQLARLMSPESTPADPPSPAGTTNAAARMAAALERYRAIAERGGWPRIQAGPALEAGDRDPRVPALRERLAATGDLAAGARSRTGNQYDTDLIKAVTVFQRRHGLEPDGVVDAATRKAVNVPARRRVRRMEINHRRIERRAIGGHDRVVRVNIPAFRVTLLEDGEVTFSTRAIVGRPGDETPPMQTHITALTINPAWYVPRSIVRDDLAPRFARRDGYAERNGFRAVSGDRALDEIDWSQSPTVAVRQEPGPSNALGRIKFEMPNRRAIYLHDTPERHLFDARQRAFSAGCVRVEEPMELAARLTGLERDRLERMARDGATRTLRLGWRTPVQLVYFTAWVDASGRVQFRPDIYNRDNLERTTRS